MKFKELISSVLEEFGKVFERVDEKQIEDFIDAIIKAKRIFVLGVGREGLSSRALAMRLMHLGKTVHWLWDDTTPAIGEGDLLIANSGSGNIMSVYHVAQRAKGIGASIATITANPGGNVAKISQVVVHLPAEVWGEGVDVVHSVQPMGCLFEQSLLILGYSFN